MNYWITTDTHFNHEKIIELAGRPIDFERKIHSAFTKILQDDVLIHLGDICIGNDKEVHKKYIGSINCKKILVRGNHDNKSDHWYLNNGWDFVCESFENTFYGMKILFSHKPVPWNGNFDVNIHGHLHNLGHRQEEVGNCMNFLISLELMGYSVFDLRKLVENIQNHIVS